MLRTMYSISTIKSLCKYLPPLLSQKLRAKLIARNEEEIPSFNFRRNAFTGGVFLGNTKDFHALRFYVHGFYDWKNIVLAKEFLKVQKGDIIEVGSNIGTESVSLAKINPHNIVHAFEPVRENFRNLQKIKKTNNFDNLHLYKVLVSDKNGISRFELPDSSNSGSGYIQKTKTSTSEEFEVVTLDKKLSHINSCCAIIVDVEGHEYNVLKGSLNLIQKFRPFLILEINSHFLQKRAGCEVQDIYGKLKSMEYDCFYFDKLFLKKVNIKKFKNNKNWICIPVEKIGIKKYLLTAVLVNALNPFINIKII